MNDMNPEKHGWKGWEALTAIGTLAMFIVFTLFSIVQNCDTQHALALADSSNQLTRKSIEIAEQAKRSSDLASERSYQIATGSNEIAERGLKATERNMALTAEISKSTIQPLVYIDSVDRGSVI